MRTKAKVWILLLGVLLLMTVAAVGTIAYLTDREEVVNTFTVGQVDIDLDETAVHTDGTPIDGAERVKGNKYHLIPGQTYVKDPMITVAEDSEESYVRMLVTFNKLAELDVIFASEEGANLASIFNGYDSSYWIYRTETRDEKANTVTYEFRYFKTVDGSDGELDPLFDSFTLPGEIDGEALSTISDLKITIVGHAIQKAGFETEDTAWERFAVQTDK